MPRPKKAAKLLARTLNKGKDSNQTMEYTEPKAGAERDATRQIGSRKDIGVDIQRLSKR